MTPKRRFAVGTVHCLAGGLALEVTAHVLTKHGRLTAVEFLSARGYATMRAPLYWTERNFRRKK